MSEYSGIVESVSGPTTLCVSVTIGNTVVPRRVKLRNIVPRDAEACAQWLANNLVGGFVFLSVERTDRTGNYIADVDIDGRDVATCLVAEGLAD